MYTASKTIRDIYFSESEESSDIDKLLEMMEKLSPEKRNELLKRISTFETSTLDTSRNYAIDQLNELIKEIKQITANAQSKFDHIDSSSTYFKINNKTHHLSFKPSNYGGELVFVLDGQEYATHNKNILLNQIKKSI